MDKAIMEAPQSGSASRILSGIDSEVGIASTNRLPGTGRINLRPDSGVKQRECLEQRMKGHRKVLIALNETKILEEGVKLARTRRPG
jgi:hypothetical protein